MDKTHPDIRNWPATFQEAVAFQEALRRQVRLVPLAQPPRLVAGVAKSRLVGEGVEPDQAAGSCNALIWKGKQVGLILRTQKGIKPLYISPGHRITLPECLEITLGCLTRYRLPLPVRQADRLSRSLRA